MPKLTEDEMQAKLEDIARLPSASMMRAELRALIRDLAPPEFVAFDVDKPRKRLRVWFSDGSPDHLFVDADGTDVLLHPADVERLRGWLGHAGE